MDRILALAVGSLAGGFARWMLSGFVLKSTRAEFPYGTLLVNLSGCLLIGLLHGLEGTRFPLSVNGRMLLMIGFCGAFTTFSTWMMETSLMMDRGNVWGAFGYLSASILLGFGLFRIGAQLPKSFSAVAVASPASFES